VLGRGAAFLRAKRNSSIQSSAPGLVVRAFFMTRLDATIINYSSDAAVLRASYSAVADEIRRGPVTRA